MPEIRENVKLVQSTIVRHGGARGLSDLVDSIHLQLWSPPLPALYILDHILHSPWPRTSLSNMDPAIQTHFSP